MTAKELINLLQEMPPETKIVIRGYEEGFNDISDLNPVRIIRNADSKWYYGEYIKSEAQGAMDAIELFGENINE